MKAKRWTLGVVLVAAVSLWGLVEADASPFSSYILSDDIGNMVRGSAAEANPWADGSSGDGNNGHGNNVDGVDSSNKGNSKAGQDTLCADGTVCDDEIKTTGSTKK